MSGAANNPYLGTSRDDLLRIMTAPNAGAHNAVYRGKRLGTEPTEAEYAAIDAGTFDDMYIGDYWDKGGVNWRIAAFNYFLHTGDTKCATNHVVVVPDTSLYNAAMNSSKTTAGGYVNSVLYKTGLDKAKDIIKKNFGAHVLNHRIYLVSAVENGVASKTEWADSEVDLMCEQMVYGSGIFSPVSDGSNAPSNYRVERSQLPLFQLDASKISGTDTYWLRDVISDMSFADIYFHGAADQSGATNTYGVRPYFCIC